MLRASRKKSNKFPTKNKRGRPAHVATKKLKRRVKNLAAVPYTQDEIAEQLGITVKTLRKKYRKQLAVAQPELFNLAIGGLRHGLLEKKPWAICFFLKTKGKDRGWLERAEVTGKDGKDLFAGLDLSKLSEDKFKQLKDILKDAGVQIKE